MTATMSCSRINQPSWVWGLPLSPLTRSQAADAVMTLIEAGEPSYFITANTHYAMLTQSNAGLRAINEGAAFILADGAPLVWASRYGNSCLPERVAGSDLIYDLCECAAAKEFGVFLLGGALGLLKRPRIGLNRSIRTFGSSESKHHPFATYQPKSMKRFWNGFDSRLPTFCSLPLVNRKGNSGSPGTFQT